jgi:ketosteroid isomerase-like protein
MKPTLSILFAVLCLLSASLELYSQSDKEQIAAIRNASNTALKSYDHKKVLSYLTDDVLTTTGNGSLLCGKKELEAYILEGVKSRMYWIRETKEIIVNQNRGLAWETGSWNAYDPDEGDGPLINGNYSAMWTKESGAWKIRSQLFVTLHELRATK